MSSTNNNKQTVGAQIPDRLFQVINLHTLTRPPASKSQVIRDALLLWVERNSVDINDLINDLANRYESEWLRVKSQLGDEASKQAFKTELRTKLKDKNVSTQLIERIIKRL